MVQSSELLGGAREAFARGDWSTARDTFLEARRRGPLDLVDLERLSSAAWWLGDGVGSMSAAEEIYHCLDADGDAEPAAMRAMALSLEWAIRGDVIVAQAWLNRARRLLRHQRAGPAHGYLAYLEASITMDVLGDPAPAEQASVHLADLAREHGDPALQCFSRVLAGLAAVRRGDCTSGFGDLDEAMLPVLAGRVPPLWSGDIFCTVIHLCHELGDLARMRAWTDALERWAGPLSRTFMYAGVTRIHQLQLTASEGGWDQVEAEMAGRSADLVGSHGWMAGAGVYELGEVRRLRGDLEGAHEAYARCRELGVEPQPGEALMAYAAGRATEAAAALRAAMGAQELLERARLLLSAVEVGLAAGDVELAEHASRELDHVAARFQTPGLCAWSAQARALRQLAAHEWEDALAQLETAAQVYRQQRMRYATGQAHELMARARVGTGELTYAAADAATALEVYRRLGATPDITRLEAEQRRIEAGATPGGLTAREVEILSRVSTGASNRDVAGQLFISEKTVSRHLANIFVKLGVTSRTAAAAWAHDHGVHHSPHVGRT